MYTKNIERLFIFNSKNRANQPNLIGLLFKDNLISLLLNIFTVVSTDSAPSTEIVVENVLVHNKQIGFVLGEGVVEFRGNFSKSGELSPGDIGEIVMLNVISNVQTGNVHGSIIRVGILSLDEFVMFSNNVSSNGVQSQTESSSENQIAESFAAE